MNITVTFTSSGDASIPDGTTLTFEDVDGYSLHTIRGIEETGCDRAGCRGCSFTHHQPTEASSLELKASGLHKNGPRWHLPGMVKSADRIALDLTQTVPGGES